MLFFDLDGTLVDHDHAVKKAVATMLDKADFPRTHREEELLAVWNRVLRDYYQLYLQKKLSLEEQRMERIRAFCRHFDIRPDESEIETWFQVYLQAYEDHWRLYEDVPGCLNAFGERRLGIISNGDLRQQSGKLRKTGIEGAFEIVVTSSEAGCAKPAKEIFRFACERAGVHESECIYVGDRWDADAIGAYEAGMRAIWLDRSGTYRGKRNGIEVINSLKELTLIL